MKTKILQEFLNSNLTIKSTEKLEQYIDYCIVNNQNEKILRDDGYSKSSYHHILPGASFENFINLTVNPWNGSHLLFSKHYYAHWLYTEAIEDYSQLSAFVGMHNQDTKSGRITESDLIPEDEFQLKMEERSKNHSELLNRKIIVDGIETTRNIEKTKKRNKTINNKQWRKDLADKVSTGRRMGGKFYELFKGDILILDCISHTDISLIYTNFYKSTYEKPLGYSDYARKILKKSNKEVLVGLYVKETSNKTEKRYSIKDL